MAVVSTSGRTPGLAQSLQQRVSGLWLAGPRPDVLWFLEVSALLFVNTVKPQFSNVLVFKQFGSRPSSSWKKCLCSIKNFGSRFSAHNPFMLIPE